MSAWPVTYTTTLGRKIFIINYPGEEDIYYFDLWNPSDHQAKTRAQTALLCYYYKLYNSNQKKIAKKI